MNFTFTISDSFESSIVIFKAILKIQNIFVNVSKLILLHPLLFPNQFLFAFLRLISQQNFFLPFSLLDSHVRIYKDQSSTTSSPMVQPCSHTYMYICEYPHASDLSYLFSEKVFHRTCDKKSLNSFEAYSFN